MCANISGCVRSQLRNSLEHEGGLLQVWWIQKRNGLSRKHLPILRRHRNRNNLGWLDLWSCVNFEIDGSFLGSLNESNHFCLKFCVIGTCWLKALMIHLKYPLEILISCCTMKCINDRIRITILIKILKISKQFIILAKLAWPHLRLVTRPNDSDILTNISFLLIAHCKTTIQVGHVLTRRTCAYCDGSKIFIKYKCLECHGTGVTILMVEHKWVWSWTDSMKLILDATSCWVHYRKIFMYDSRLLLSLYVHKFAPEESRGNAWK